MIWWRRLSQGLVLLVFVFLFLNTEYKDNDILPYAVNVFLRLDPLVAGAAVLAARSLIPLVWPALITVGLTLLLGRFFCGWFCPLGTILDGTSAVFFRKRRRGKEVPKTWRRAKYLVLLFLLGSSLLTLQFVFLLDPLSLLIRSLTTAVYPALNLAGNTLFGALWATHLKAVTLVTEPVYSFLKAHFLSFAQPYFRLAGLIGLLFAAILGLEYVEPRFWCRNLCPLGALFGLLGRFGLLRRKVAEPDCIGCGACRRSCRMGAVREDYFGTDAAECIRCLDCRAVCPEKAVSFPWKPAPGDDRLVDVPRRRALAAVGLGLISVPLIKTEPS